MNGKIHFIYHLEKSYAAANLGDWICTPYSYFIDYFSRYTCVLHSMWSIIWHEIERGDVVVFGGGGSLDNSDALNLVINKLTDKCDNVIICGSGTHKYADNNVFGKVPATIPINFDKTALCGIRDYKHPYNQDFVPCASCLHPAFNADRTIIKVKRQVGTIKSALEQRFAVSGVSSFVTNAEPIGTVVDYILSSDVMLVSSYHGAFWSMLLGRKVILHASRLGVDKYKYFRYPVGIYHGDKYDENELIRIASDLPSIPDFLSEARSLNYEFFRKVRHVIENAVQPTENAETLQIVSKRTAQLEFTLADVWNIVKKMNSRLTDIEKTVAK